MNKNKILHCVSIILILVLFSSISASAAKKKNSLDEDLKRAKREELRRRVISPESASGLGTGKTLDQSIAYLKSIGAWDTPINEVSNKNLRTQDLPTNTTEIVMYSLFGGVFVSILLVALYLKFSEDTEYTAPASQTPEPDADYIDVEIIDGTDADEFDYPYEDISSLFGETK